MGFQKWYYTGSCCFSITYLLCNHNSHVSIVSFNHMYKLHQFKGMYTDTFRFKPEDQDTLF